MLDIIPIPGHQQASIAVYDKQTRVMLTGDSFYPGRLYIGDWPAFVASTQRLVDFTKLHPVAMLLGNHIEMTDTPGIDYPTGTTYQPNEHRLPLQVAQLAGVPPSVIRAARKHLATLEAHALHGTPQFDLFAAPAAGDAMPAADAGIGAADDMDAPVDPVSDEAGRADDADTSHHLTAMHANALTTAQALAGIDPDQMTPRDALAQLYRLKRLAAGEQP